MITLSQHKHKIKLLQRIYAVRKHGEFGTDKKTTNLFRARTRKHTVKLPLRDFNQVISIDTKKKLAVVEGMTTYETLVDETLKYHLMPAVVPQLKTITLGGAVTGIGIESSSFKYGFPHETVTELEVFTGAGEVINAKPSGEHNDLYFGFPNSYGTLGYALSLTIRLVPVKPFVHLQYIKHTKPKEFFAQIQAICDSGRYQDKAIDFIDGVIFGKGNYVITVGTMVATAPYTSDYTFKNIYYLSIKDKTEDYLTIKDYIWRWDTDWFWCSKNLKAQNSVVRRLYGRKRLRSDYYMKLFAMEAKYGFMRKIDKVTKRPEREMVIQDVEIPIDNCEKFLEFYHKNINILPAWVCPARQLDSSRDWKLYRMNPTKLYVNFGFWDSVKARKSDPAYYNKLLENEVRTLQGKKSLYSDSYYDKKTFWRLYNKADYDILKSMYDPDGRLKDLYDKTVKRG
jgi:FAD/FMN-containing dehydrogenase